MEKKTDEKVNVRVVEIELPKIDVTKHIGKKVKIESADVYRGVYGLYLKVQTAIVETIGKGDKKIELRGSKILGLQQDENGIYGYGKDTKLGQFLARYKVTEPDKLIGKEVVLVTQVNDNNTEFLTFN